jgi:Zn finger protein HypA/HybF involved in hydrogenase expression
MIRIEPDFDEAPTSIVCESCGHSMKYMLPLSDVEFGECHKCGGTMTTMLLEDQPDDTTQSKLTDY